jgi:hypothetical protein
MYGHGTFVLDRYLRLGKPDLLPTPYIIEAMRNISDTKSSIPVET